MASNTSSPPGSLRTKALTSRRDSRYRKEIQNMDTGTLAANDNNPSIHRPFDASRYSKLVLGQMLAYMTVTPMDTGRITLFRHARNRDTLRWHVENDVLTLEDTTPSDMVKFDLIMPTQLNLQIDGLAGKIRVTEQLDTTLTFNISGDTEVKAEAVESLNGTANNFSRVQVASVRETIDVTATGAAEIIIKGGDSQQLRAKTAQGGDIRHRGTTYNAELHATGISLITVDSVMGQLGQHATEHGHIDATKWPEWPYLE